VKCETKGFITGIGYIKPLRLCFFYGFVYSSSQEGPRLGKGLGSVGTIVTYLRACGRFTNLYRHLVCYWLSRVCTIYDVEPEMLDVCSYCVVVIICKENLVPVTSLLV